MEGSSRKINSYRDFLAPLPFHRSDPVVAKGPSLFVKVGVCPKSLCSIAPTIFLFLPLVM